MNSDIISINSTTRIDKKCPLELIYDDDASKEPPSTDKKFDFMFLNIVLCTYYTIGCTTRDVLEGLVQDLERTIYTRLDDNNDDLLKKRVFVNREGVNYSLYVESKDKIEVR